MTAIANTKSVAVGNADTTPRIFNPAHLTANYVRQAVGTVEVSANDAANSVYRFARLRSSDRISSIAEAHDALGASAATNIGLYRTQADGGAVVNATLFASGLSLVAASSVKTGVTFQNLDVIKAEKRLWELIGGLNADPLVDYDLCYTVTNTGATGAGTLTCWVDYVSGN